MSDADRRDFRGAITSHFHYLFDPPLFGYIMEVFERGGEYQMQIAESPQCLVKFRLEQEVFDLSFARRYAPRVWDDESEEKLWWHSFVTLAVFENEIHPHLAVRLSPPNADLSLAGQLRAKATLLEPYLPRIIAAFGGDGADDWWRDYRAFRGRRDGSLQAIP